MRSRNDGVARAASFGRLALLITGTMILSVAGLAQESRQNPTARDGSTGEALDSVVQRLTKGGFWGSVLVAKKGNVLLAKGYGSADYSSRPNTPGTLFEIASASKQFTASGVLRLVMDGKLAVADAIDKFFPDVPADKKAITVHQLLSHTSGISGRTGVPYASKLSRDKFVAEILAAPLASKPGETWEYCNTGYALLAAIVEVTSGMSFERYMKEKVFSPAGLTDTGFIQDDSLDRSRAASRISEDGTPATAIDWHWSWGYRGMGGVVTSVYDLEKWDRALRSKRVLDEGALGVLYGPVKGGYAAGWFVETTPRGTRKVYHGGGVQGFATLIARYLEEDVLIVVLSNGATNVVEIEAGLAGVLFPQPRPDTEAEIRVDAERLDAHRSVTLPSVSAWKVQKDGGRIVLVAANADPRDGSLTVRMSEPTARLLASDLQNLLATKSDEAESRSEAKLYVGPYKLDDGLVRLPEGISLRILPRYSGIGADGKKTVDERLTMIIDDPKNRFWCLLAKLSKADGSTLLGALRGVLK